MKKNECKGIPIVDRKILLTQRELQVLQLISEGKTNVQIAKELKVSVHTVKAHVASILIKFDVKVRLQAVTKAIIENIINI